MTEDQDVFDYIIVGAGSAGCVLAHRLTEDPSMKVLLIEAGGRDLDPLIHIPIGFGVMWKHRLHDWGYDSEGEPGLLGRKIEALRGKTLGGSSSINVQAFTRGDRADFDRWVKLGAAGWSYDEILRYFIRLETWSGESSSARGTGGPVHVQWCRSPDPLYAAWEAAASASGYRTDYDMNQGSVEGFGRVQFNILQGRRHSSAAAYLRPVAQRSNLRVIVKAFVTRILFEGKAASGVEYVAQGTSSVRSAKAAREVILSAGAFNTPKLLMLSGIGPATHLASLGIPVKVDSPVGENLREHWATPNVYERSSPGYFHRQLRADRISLSMLRAHFFGSGPATTVPTNLFGFVKTDATLDSPDLEFLFSPTAADAHAWFPLLRPPYRDAFAIRAAIMQAESRGCVRLASADPRVPPLIRYNALESIHDVSALVRGLRIGRDLANRQEMDAYRGEELAPGPTVQSDDELAAYVRRTAVPVHHPACTCAMGGEGAVLDPSLRVRGVEKLRVVDASAMPALITGHINAGVMMMAEKASDLITGRARQPATSARP